MIELCIKEYLLLLCTILLVFTTGTFVLSFHSKIESLFFRLFITYILGFSILILCYSVLQAKGRTILVLTIPIILYIGLYVKAYRTKFSISFDCITKDLLWSIAFCSLVFLFQSHFYFDFTTPFFKPINRDYFFYASVSDSLKNLGIENFFLTMNYFFPKTVGLLPYHYPELWFTSLLSKLFNNPSVSCYVLLTSTMLYGTLLFGISSLFEKKLSNPIVLFILSFLLLGISGLFFQSYLNYSLISESWWHSFVSVIGYSGTKFCYVYIFALLGIILFSNKHVFLGLLILSLTPFYSVGLLPGIWGGIGLLIVCNIVYNKLFKLNKAEKRILLFFLVYEIVGFYFFYKLLGVSYTDNYASKHITSVVSLNQRISFQTIKHFWGNIVVYFTKVSIFYIPYFILLLLLGSWNRILWFYLCLVLLCGAVTSTITHGLTDSMQFSSNVGILFIVVIIYDFSHSCNTFLESKSIVKGSLIALAFCLFLYSFFNTVTNKLQYSIPQDDKGFVLNVAHSIDNSNMPIVVFYNHNYYQNRISIRDVNSVFDKDLIAIHQLKNIPLVTPVANSELYSKMNYMDYADTFYYAQFTPLNVWRSQNPKHNLQNFISRFNLKYFYFMQGVEIPSFIQNNIKEQFVSPLSKSSFIIIK